jgi:hypothetical protein
LAESSKDYHQQIQDPSSEGARYLAGKRGLTWKTVSQFRLGYVGNPVVGHEEYQGRLCIPYLSPLGEVVSAKFRRIDLGDEEGTSAKYLGLHGEDGSHRIFNPVALTMPGRYICICEGELDAITATQEGLPAVGMPGVQSYNKDTMAPPFRGYDVVFILADSDDKGQGKAFAEKIAGTIRNCRIVPMDPGYDVNSWCMANPGKLRERLGVWVNGVIEPEKDAGTYQVGDRVQVVADHLEGLEELAGEFRVTAVTPGLVYPISISNGTTKTLGFPVAAFEIRKVG